MNASRRDVLRSGALASLLPLAGLTHAAPAGGDPAMLLVDLHLPGGARFARQARRAGLRVAHTGGEIIHRLLEADASDAPLIGYTGYVDYALARDALRLRSPLRNILVLDRKGAKHLMRGGAQDEVLLLSLAQQLPTSAATRYLWLA